MAKDTHEIISEIKATNNIERYMRDNVGEFNSKMFLRTLKKHIANSGLSQAKIAESSSVTPGYLSNILNKARSPERDVVIKLAFGLKLSVDEANRLLMLAGHGELYPRIEREAIILHCLNKKITLIDTNILLTKCGEKELKSGIR